jgi:hypothetical protein
MGARVVVSGRRLEPLEETVAIAEGGRCEPRVCDIREEDQVEALVDDVCAGIAASTCWSTTRAGNT